MGGSQKAESPFKGDIGRGIQLCMCIYIYMDRGLWRSVGHKISKESGVPVWGLHTEDYSIFGLDVVPSVYGSHHLGVIKDV